MPVESSADLAAFFNDSEFAEGATWLAPAPGSTAQPCTVIMDRGQGRELFQGGETRTVASERHLWVSKAELPSVMRGGTFTIDADGEVLTVAGLPKLDQAGQLWSVQLVLAG